MNPQPHAGNRTEPLRVFQVWGQVPGKNVILLYICVSVVLSQSLCKSTRINWDYLECLNAIPSG
jgi:hypothetical protein